MLNEFSWENILYSLLFQILNFFNDLVSTDSINLALTKNIKYIFNVSKW